MARIKLKHVNSFGNPNRENGEVRHCFRRRGEKAIRLPGQPGSREFMDAYHLALAGPTALAGKPEIGASRTAPGTIAALIVSYYKSDEWLSGIEEETRKTRRRIIEKFRVRHGDKRVAMLRPDHVRDMLKEIAKPGAKRNFLKAVRPLLRHAVPTMLKEDPTIGITVKMPKTKGFHSWTDGEVAQYRSHWKYGTQQRLVFEFALESVSRRGEIARLGRQHVANGRIRIERLKGSDDVDIPLSPELQAAIDAMPKGNLTFIVTAAGKPRSKVGLGNDFAEWAGEAGLPDHCRLHGLKKAGMRRLAEDGGTTHELMAISGHRTLSEVQRYTQGANNRKLADSGMAKRRGGNENADVTNAVPELHKREANALK